MLLTIDQSLSDTGICMLSEEGRMVTTHVKTSSSMEWFKRMSYILSFLDSARLAFESNPIILNVAMEGYAFGGSFKGFVLGELGGCIRYHYGLQDINVQQISIAHHKMYVARNGRAKKPEVIKALKTRFGIEERNDNIADAISMGLCYSHYLAYIAGTRVADAYETILFERMRLNFGKREPKPKKPSRNRENTRVLTRSAKRTGRGDDASKGPAESTSSDKASLADVL
jgi:Holliday junction resolvasome RuvABC endonuclease subunit